MLINKFDLFLYENNIQLHFYLFMILSQYAKYSSLNVWNITIKLVKYIFRISVSSSNNINK